VWPSPRPQLLSAGAAVPGPTTRPVVARLSAEENCLQWTTTCRSAPMLWMQSRVGSARGIPLTAVRIRQRMISCLDLPWLDSPADRGRYVDHLRCTWSPVRRWGVRVASPSPRSSVDSPSSRIFPEALRWPHSVVGSWGRTPTTDPGSAQSQVRGAAAGPRPARHRRAVSGPLGTRHSGRRTHCPSAWRHLMSRFVGLDHRCNADEVPTQRPPDTLS
jgi:hypothetical protein